MSCIIGVVVMQIYWHDSK